MKQDISLTHPTVKIACGVGSGHKGQYLYIKAIDVCLHDKSSQMWN